MTTNHHPSLYLDPFGRLIVNKTVLRWGDVYPEEVYAMKPPSSFSTEPVVSDLRKTPKNNYTMTMKFYSSGAFPEAEVNVWKVWLAPDGKIIGGWYFRSGLIAFRYGLIGYGV